MEDGFESGIDSATGESGVTGKGARIVVTAIQQAVDAACGCSNLAYEEAKYLARTGNEVWLVAPAIAANAAEFEPRDGVNLLRYQVPRFQALDPRRAWAHQKRARAVLKRHLREPVDLVHGHVPLPFQAVCNIYRGRARRCYSVHSPVMKEMEIEWPKDGARGWLRHAAGLPWLNHIERNCMVSSDCVTAFSEFTKELLGEVHGSRIAEKVATIPGWVDLERFVVIENRRTAKLQLGWPTDVPILFTLRRLARRMGIENLLRATRNLLDRRLDFRLIIGGTGPLGPEMQRLAQELQLLNKVRFLGYVPDPDVPLMYAACDAFVLPTAALECFGLTAIEALACGRPVLASPTGAIPEILNRFEPRWTAQAASEEAITELLADFLLGKLPIHSAEQLRALVARHYDSNAVIPRLARLLLN